MLKFKKAVTLLIAGAMMLSSIQVAFAKNYSEVLEYKKTSYTRNFEGIDAIDSERWQLTNAEVVLAQDNDDNNMAEIQVADSTAVTIRVLDKSTGAGKTGIVTYKFDVKLPKDSAIKKSMTVGLRAAGGSTGSNYNDIPLFLLTPTGGIRQAVNSDWKDKANLTVDVWYTIFVEIDTETGMFYVSYGEQDKELKDISSNLNNDYYKNGTNDFIKGVTALTIKKDANSSGESEKNTLIYLDNLDFKSYPKLYTKINELTSVEEVESVLKAYNDADIVKISELYFKLSDKSAINQKLIDTEFTSDDEITATVNEQLDGIIKDFAKYETPIYVDLTESYNADFIGKVSDNIELDEDGNQTQFGIGVNRAVWLNDINGRDNYTGQGYDGAKISTYTTADGVLTATNNCDESRGFKIPTNVLSAGTNDAVTVSSIDENDGDTGFKKRGEYKNVALSGKKLSEISVAAMGGVPNLAYLGAKVNYTDGSSEDVFLSDNNVPSSGQSKNTLYQTVDFGAMIYPNEQGTLVDDDRELSSTNGSVDNRTKSYMTVMQIPTDTSKNVESVDLYAKSKWGASSIAIFGITEMPATMDDLLVNINAADGVTTDMAKENYEKVLKSYNSIQELVTRGFYKSDDVKVQEIQALYDALKAGDTTCKAEWKTVFKDAEGNEKDSFADAALIDVTATCENDTVNKETAVLIAAFYDDNNVLLDMTLSETETIAGYGKTDIKLNDISKPEGTKFMNVFVWSDLENITPICNAYEVK